LGDLVVCQLELALLDEIIVILGIKLKLDEDVTARKRNNAIRFNVMDRRRKWRTHKRFERLSRILLRKVTWSKSMLDCEREKYRDCDGEKEHDETALILHFSAQRLSAGTRYRERQSASG
jgi:hypothetical protein